MDIINIFLLTKDMEYGAALSRILQSENRFLSVKMVDPTGQNPGDLSEFDLVLTDEDSDFKWDHHLVVRLTEKRSIGDDDMEMKCMKTEKSFIFKYQSARAIAKDIKLIYSNFYGRPVVLHTGDRPDITAVFCSTGGAGCTSVTLGLCQELQRFHGRKVLYLTLEEFASTCFYFKADFLDMNHGIARFLYQLLYKRTGLESGIEQFLMTDDYGISAFVPAAERNPLTHLKEDELDHFIEYLLQNTGFDNILIDCGNNGGLTQLSHLKMADHHVYVGRRGENQLRKNDYFRWLTKSLGDLPRPDPIVVANFFSDDEVENDEYGNNNTSCDENGIIEIYEDPESFFLCGNEMKIKLDQNFGVGIRDLSSRIIAG